MVRGGVEMLEQAKGALYYNNYSPLVEITVGTPIEKYNILTQECSL